MAKPSRAWKFLSEISSEPGSSTKMFPAHIAARNTNPGGPITVQDRAMNCYFEMAFGMERVSP